MNPGKGKMPSKSIKEVPGRSKQRVESSNPIPRGNPIPRTSKLKLISPEEAIQLSSGSLVFETPRPELTRATSQAQRPLPAPLTSGAPRHEPTSATFKASRPEATGATFKAQRPVPSPLSSEAPRPEPTRATFLAPRRVPAPLTSETPRPDPTSATFKAPRPVPARLSSETPRPEPTRATFLAPRPVPSRLISETPRPVPACRTSEAPRPVADHPTTNAREVIVCGLRAWSMYNTTVRQRTKPSLRQSKLVESPPSPRSLHIRSRVHWKATNATTQVVEGPVVEGCDRAKDHGSKDISQSISNDKLSELLLHLPALNPIWKGRIVDSATMPEFDCELSAKPVSNISRKARNLSKLMPTVLKVELLPTGNLLNDLFDRSPKLSDVDMYLFPDENKIAKSKREYDNLLEAMATRNAIIKAKINDTELFIFSSKLLEKTSQYFVNTQKQTENFLWGCFLQTKNSEELVPGTDKDLDGGDAVDMEIDIEYPTPSLPFKLFAESQTTPSISLVKVKTEFGIPPGFENQSRSTGKVNKEVSVPPGFENLSRSTGKVNKEVSVPPGFENLSTSTGKMNKEVSVPPGFEKIWEPPLMKLNIHGTLNTRSNLNGSAGLVRNQAGKWVFGYGRCHKELSEVAATFLALYHGLKLLWDSGHRRIRLEASLDIINCLTTKSNLFHKRRSILGSCKDMILKEWECEIYQISKEENSCAEWLANRIENYPQGLVFFEEPPQGLMGLLEKDLAALQRS